MKNRAGKKPLQVVLEDGEPSAVILGIEEYREMLERLDDVEDLAVLEQMRKRPLKFRRVEEFLEEYSPNVLGQGSLGSCA